MGQGITLASRLDQQIVERLAKKGVMRSGLTLHGLRHARGVELAMAGAGDAEIMAQIEHGTDKAAKIYRRQAERCGLADNRQAKIENVIDIRATRRAKCEFGGCKLACKRRSRERAK